ncbi:MarR family winged helix-turn-helix transcriptional regulator [Zhihengliuella sp.]|uniref:MarR family winged helix-turn-helix transcriptional regulator n=1 Tax=Zhihengliuella sp. TaxID=1954483 RepID=UPI00281128D3|nr:MarR family winged helix-turn-helix transcriptional regulator [Zhihengliuella sp.]
MSSHEVPSDAERQEAINAMEEQLSLLWRRSRAIGNKVARSVHPDMEPGAYGLLRTLQRCGAMRLTELAAEIGVGKPTVSRQVSMLESIGVVSKEVDPSDGRAQTISLTPAGAEQLAAAQTARRRVFHTLLEDWQDEELAELAGLLGKLNRTYQKDQL